MATQIEQEPIEADNLTEDQVKITLSDDPTPHEVFEMMIAYDGAVVSQLPPWEVPPYISQSEKPIAIGKYIAGDRTALLKALLAETLHQEVGQNPDNKAFFLRCAESVMKQEPLLLVPDPTRNYPIREQSEWILVWEKMQLERNAAAAFVQQMAEELPDSSTLLQALNVLHSQAHEDKAELARLLETSNVAYEYGFHIQQKTMLIIDPQNKKQVEGAPIFFEYAYAMAQWDAHVTDILAKAFVYNTAAHGPTSLRNGAQLSELEEIFKQAVDQACLFVREYPILQDEQQEGEFLRLSTFSRRKWSSHRQDKPIEPAESMDC